ncbi:hypothetical protein [Nocardia africana]|uniref:Uncharacterized protein n=1 Tax=Nocardia africana TaxID=134964 RepID=A0ABW6NEC6_9NOCA
MASGSYRHPKCYANVNGGCSTTISGEHYISHGLIKLYTFNDSKARILHDNGFGITHPVQPSRFVANVLCREHNTQFHSYDDEAVKFASFLQRTALSFFEEKTWGNSETVAISGDNLERWALKLLLTHAAVNAYTGDGGRITGRIPDYAVKVLLGEADWPRSGGLCVAGKKAHEHLIANPFSYEALVTGWWGAYPLFNKDQPPALVGGIVELAGIGLGICLDDRIRTMPQILIPDNPMRHSIRRPSSLVWRIGEVEKRIQFTWADKEEHVDVTYIANVR